jgi:hypothetical protein
VKLAKDTGTITWLPEDTHSIILKDGQHLEGKEALDLYTKVEKMLNNGTDYSRSHTARIPSDLSLMDWFRKKVKGLEVSQGEKDRMLQVVQNWGGYVGEPIETQSFKNCWLESSMPGGMTPIPHSNYQAYLL